MPGGEVLRIGPFTGGLNLGSDPATVADTELLECINFELDIDGSLRSRPPIQDTSTTVMLGGRALPIGSATFGSDNYVFVSNTNGIWRTSDGITYTSVQADVHSEYCVQYRGKVWFVATPTSTNAGGNWDPSVGWTTDSDIPRGQSGVIHKERLYIVPGDTATSNGSRLKFSDAADLGTWTGSNFIDVSPDDGSFLMDVLVYNDNLLLFKQDSTFVLAYDLDPSEAILKEINPVIGAKMKRCVTQFENQAYVLHRDKVYEIVNYDFAILNPKVPFVFDNSQFSSGTRTETTSLSLFGDRLFVRYYNKTYVFGLRTRTWSEWASTHLEGNLGIHNLTPLVRLPSAESNTSGDKYFAFLARSNNNQGYTMIDGYTATAFEGDTDTGIKIICILTTKDYDMADPVHYKRLFWWGADLVSGNQIIGSIEPITFSFNPSWDALGLGWDSITGPWDSPLITPSPTVTVIAADTIFEQSKAVKFKKALRFRKANFSVQLETTGKSTNGPVKVFSLIAVIATKQTISKQVA